jgi:hypothetical protein
MAWPVGYAGPRKDPPIGIPQCEPEVIFLVIWFAPQLCEKCLFRYLGIENGH